MPVNITVNIDKLQLNTVTQAIGKEFTDIMNKQVFSRWRENVQATFDPIYGKHARNAGQTTLVGMLSRKTQFTKDGFQMVFFVNPAKTKSGKDINIWESIAHQVEFGETRDGSKQIRPNKAKILAIPIHPEAKGKSPSKIQGRWINKLGTLFFIKDQKSGKTVNRRRGRRRKVLPIKSRAPRKRHSAQRREKSIILFIGVKSVNVRRAKPYFRPAVDEYFGGGTNSQANKRLKKIISEELSIEVTNIS